MGKNILTSGDIAKLLGVSPRTVCKLIDGGDLPGFRIPGSKHRRVPLSNYNAFAVAKGLPLCTGILKPTRPKTRFMSKSQTNSRI